MKYVSTLLVATAVGSLFAPTAQASTAKHKAHHHAAKPAAHADTTLSQEVAELRAEVSALHQQIDAQHQAQASTQVEVAQTQQQVGALSQSVAQVPATAQAAAHTEVTTAINNERKKPYAEFKGLRLTPGGFLEMAGVYREHYQGNDIATSYAIPFGNSHTYYNGEGRFSARQSRLSLLAQGNANKNTTLSMYGEFDFLGGAQTANSNESNSYNPRIRHLYASIDWAHDNGGIHLLAGQTWSLVTMNTKGITPRNELTPPQIEAQYIPGFVWARQPQVRLTVDTADHHLWAAVSAENPATTFAGAIPPGLTYNAPAGSGFDSANSLSLNNTPDFVGKIAYEGMIAGRSLHLEGFGIARSFEAHLNGVSNVSKTSVGVGGGITLQALPKVLDLQFSGMSGKGIGRYGSAQLSDVAFAADGSIHPVKEFMLLGGATLHATKMLDLYLFAGREQEYREELGGAYGVGLLTANNAGCFTEGGTCSGNTRRIQQLTGGFWQKIYQGNYGRAQVGVQYSYTERQLFVDSNGNEPTTHQNMGLVSFRYYPF